MVASVVNVLQVHRDKQLSRAAMQIMCDLVTDVQQRLCNEAKMTLRCCRETTLSSRSLQTAVRLLFTEELRRHAVGEGMKAIRKYTASKK